MRDNPTMFSNKKKMESRTKHCWYTSKYIPSQPFYEHDTSSYLIQYMDLKRQKVAPAKAALCVCVRDQRRGRTATEKVCFQPSVSSLMWLRVWWKTFPFVPVISALFSQLHHCLLFGSFSSVDFTWVLKASKSDCPKISFFRHPFLRMSESGYLCHLCPWVSVSHTLYSPTISSTWPDLSSRVMHFSGVSLELISCFIIFRKNMRG